MKHIVWKMIVSTALSSLMICQYPIFAATATTIPEAANTVSTIDAAKAVISVLLFSVLIYGYTLYMNARANKQREMSHLKSKRGQSHLSKNTGVSDHHIMTEERPNDQTEKESTIRICPFCAAENPSTNYFCGKCGSML